MNKARTRSLAVTVPAVAAAAVAVAAVTGMTGPASAAPERGVHCVLRSATGDERCFGTFAQAIESASSGAVAAAPVGARAAVTDPEVRAKLAAPGGPSAGAPGEVVQGTFFADPDYGGDSLTITGPPLCARDGWVNWRYDLDDEWKDRISSVQTWGNCWLWLYPEPDPGGHRNGPYKAEIADIGVFMNDRAESIGFG